MDQVDEVRVDTIDPSSIESRIRLAKMIMKLFDRWQLSPADQAALLGFGLTSRVSLNQYRMGKPLPKRADLLDRVGNLLAIHKSLRILFPHDLSLAYSWVGAQNRAFDGMRPLDVMVKYRFAGLLRVRAYLEHARAR